MAESITMDNDNWSKKIKNNFNKAANNYSEYCLIQKFFSKKIVNLLKGLDINKGDWFDLGSGTGLLADDIEKCFLKQKVCRVDFCNKMLLMNKKESKKILWDLNKGLHPSIKNAPLLVSNFCIHWLNNPEKILESWFMKLQSGGKLIISYPTNNCFLEWKNTCKNNQIEYTGLIFPKEKNMLKNFSPNEIITSNNYSYRENYPDIYKLFRSIINTGAQSSITKNFSVGEFKRLAKCWPKDKKGFVELSWEINILILSKP